MADRLTPVVRTFPSVAQLLPVYTAVHAPEGALTRLDSVDVPDLPTSMVRDAFSFHAELREAQEANDVADRMKGQPSPYDLIAIAGGGSHPTDHGLSVSAGDLKFHATLDDLREWSGDGTVTGLSATPHEFEHTGRTVLHSYRHTALPNEKPVLRQLSNVYNAIRCRSTWPKMTCSAWKCPTSP